MHLPLPSPPDVTDCFSTGCEIIEDECECGYSNSCPTKNYTFDDIFACEESIAQPQENSTTVTPEIEGGECNAESPLSQCAQGQICLSEDIDFPHGTCQCKKLPHMFSYLKSIIVNFSSRTIIRLCFLIFQ